MLIGVDERDYDRQFAAGFDQVRSVNFAASQKTGYGMEHDGAKDIFLAQVFQDFEMQRMMVPGIAFGQIDGDLDGHNFGEMG